MEQDWNTLSPEEQMKQYLQELVNVYHFHSKIEKTKACLIEKISIKDIEEYNRIYHYSYIPEEYMEDGPKIVGIDLAGSVLASQENLELVNYIISKVSSKKVTDFNSKTILQYLSSIKNPQIVFCPFHSFTKVHDIIDWRNSHPYEFYLGKTDAIFIFSNDFVKWNSIIIIGQHAIKWKRKIPPSYPKNLTDFIRYPDVDDVILAAYKRRPEKWEYFITTVSKFEIINKDQIIVLSKG